MWRRGRGPLALVFACVLVLSTSVTRRTDISTLSLRSLSEAKIARADSGTLSSRSTSETENSRLDASLGARAHAIMSMEVATSVSSLTYFLKGSVEPVDRIISRTGGSILISWRNMKRRRARALAFVEMLKKAGAVKVAHDAVAPCNPADPKAYSSSTPSVTPSALALLEKTSLARTSRSGKSITVNVLRTSLAGAVGSTQAVDVDAGDSYTVAVCAIMKALYPIVADGKNKMRVCCIADFSNGLCVGEVEHRSYQWGIEYRPKSGAASGSSAVWKRMKHETETIGDLEGKWESPLLHLVKLLTPCDSQFRPAQTVSLVTNKTNVYQMNADLALCNKFTQVAGHSFTAGTMREGCPSKDASEVGKECCLGVSTHENKTQRLFPAVFPEGYGTSGYVAKLGTLPHPKCRADVTSEHTTTINNVGFEVIDPSKVAPLESFFVKKQMNLSSVLPAQPTLTASWESPKSPGVFSQIWHADPVTKKPLGVSLPVIQEIWLFPQRMSMWRCCAYCRAAFSAKQKGTGKGCTGYAYWGLRSDSSASKEKTDKCVLFHGMGGLQLETNSSKCDETPHIRSAEKDSICDKVWDEEMMCRSKNMPFDTSYVEDGQQKHEAGAIKQPQFLRTRISGETAGTANHFVDGLSHFYRAEMTWPGKKPNEV